MHEKRVVVDDILSSRLLIIAPHIDDEVLGCGGTMLLHHDKRKVYCIYVSGGERSPMPLLPWQGQADEDLVQVREQEARNALVEIGVSEENATFMRFPDGELTRHIARIRPRLKQEIERIKPTIICVPSFCDLHPDHVAVNRAIREMQRDANFSATVLEYFIYFRWPLIRERDIRRRAPEDRLLEVDVSSVNSRKRAALACYTSQTRTLYPWQDTPVLTSASIQQRCQEPEYLLISDPSKPAWAGFSGSPTWLWCAHFIQTHGKRPKDQFIATLKWLAAPLAPKQ